jgi:hypothetical protein
MPRFALIFSAPLLVIMTTQSFAGDFKADLGFLRQYTDVIVLQAPGGQAQVAVSSKLQGRVMTSTAEGLNGLSFGWINRDYFSEAAKGNVNKHISPYGGEDRFWLGPEGGQFAIFFAPGSTFDLEHWFTPPAIDTEPFDVVSSGGDRAMFSRQMSLTNFSGTKFQLLVTREIRVLGPDAAWQRLGVPPMSGVRLVAYESDNTVRNMGDADWKKESGLLSIWILEMFNASPTTVVAVPVKPGEGQAVNDDYFGKVPSDRLKVANDVVFFKGDANFRSKIGIPPARVKPIACSYDSTNKVLTIVQFTFDPQARDYVNSAWKMQDNPFGGDVSNSYNDGPPAPGKPQLGKFYELESSSPARELKKGETLRHVHRTMHLQGDESQLDRVARALLGVGLIDIEKAFAR